MSKIFDQNNPVMRALSKIFDIGWLSILYIIFCIPVITIGPATTALYYTAIKVVRRERSYVWTEFWSCFKTNFKTGFFLGIFFTLLYAILAFNVFYIGAGSTIYKGYGGYFVGAYIALFIILFCLATYAFPILSRFEMKATKIMRFSFYVAFRHILMTLCMVVIQLAAVALVYFGFIYSFPLALLFAPGLAAFGCTFPMEHVLKKYMPEQEAIVTEDGDEIKEWYNE